MKIFLWSLLVIFSSPAVAISPKLPIVSPLKIVISQFHQSTLTCGLKVLMLEDKELPLVTGALIVPGGYRIEPAGKEGLVGMLNDCIPFDGAGNRDANQLNRAVEDRAASIWAGADKEKFTVNFDCLSEDLPAVLDLFGGMLLKPRLRGGQVAKMIAIDQINREEDSPDSAVEIMAKRVFYQGTAYGNLFTLKSVTSVTPDDLLSFFNKHYGPKGSVLVVSGAFDKTLILAKLEDMFRGWKEQEPLPDMGDLKLKGHNIYFFAKDASQVAVRFALPGIKRFDRDEFPLMIANYILGGGNFNSRLMSRIRSDKGLAYGVSSYYYSLEMMGAFVISGSTRPDALGDYLRLMFRIAHQYATEGPTQLELADAKEALTQEFVFQFTSPRRLAELKAYLTIEGYPDDYLETYRENINAVTRFQVAAAAHRILMQEDWVLSVAGPANLQKALEVYGPVKVMKHVNDPL